MKRHTRKEDGMYHVAGKKYAHLRGSRAQVGHGNAYMTQGGLKLKDLHFNKKTGRWVSAKKHRTAKKDNNLVKHGWSLAKKGSFGASPKGGRKTRRKSRK